MPRQPSPQHAHTSSKAAKADRPPAEVPLSIEQQRFALVRKLSIFISDWRRCSRRNCRRLRACTPPPDVECGSPRRRRPSRDMSPEREAAEKAHLKRLLQRRLAEIRAEEDARLERG
jgi:hypothetical protein